MGQKGVRGQAGGFSGGLQGGEIDVGCEVLFAGVRQEVGIELMLVVGAEGAVGSVGCEEFFGGEAVIEREQFATAQRVSGLGPPLFGGGTGVENEAVGEMEGEELESWGVEELKS